MGNWDLVMAEAAIFIGVFLNDQTVYDAGMTKFLNRVPAYIYLESDGDLPKTAPGDTTTSTQAGIVTYWQGQSVFNVSGLSQETCRDFEHTGYGLASIGHVAETSRIQGRDLFNEGTAHVAVSWKDTISLFWASHGSVILRPLGSFGI
ncbi:hypothetical protein HYQ46_003162 [Verticillium longisporum]|nr:hypothetical protein HYQ46_003162 [Verticillium longisporum]